MKIITSASLAAACFVVIGCGSGGGTYTPTPVKPVPAVKVQPGDEPNLMPLKVGNQWVYTATETRQAADGSATRTSEVTFRVRSTTPASGGTKAVIEVTLKGKVQETQGWLINPKGIFQLSGGQKNIPYTPMQPAILFPVEEGKTFEWKGSGLVADGSQGMATLKNKILGSQEIDTDMGRMSGIAVETTGDFKGKFGQSKMASTTWWVPNVGLARWRMELGTPKLRAVQVLKLKTYTLK